MPATILSAGAARKRILDGRPPRGIVVEEGVLNLSGSKINKLPEDLTCYELDASNTAIKTIPDSLSVECGLYLQGCRKLQALPKGLQVGTLDVSECAALATLPEDLGVWFLRAQRCTSLLTLPKRAQILHGGLDLAGCRNLVKLPSYLRDLATLDISDCPFIDSLPKALRVKQWVDIGGSGIDRIVEPISRCQWRWRGVPVNQKIAFHPETLTSQECLKETNTEVRRVMIERMGFDKFAREAGGKTLNADTDPGGKRELIRVPLKDDEDIICLSCYCPSTGRHYLLRVPPTIKTCHAAAAWMAGFDDPAKYNPLVET